MTRRPPHVSCVARTAVIYVTCVLSGLLALATPLAGQTLNPNVIEFLPPQLAAAVNRYDIAFYQASAADPFLVVNIGKPSPQADGMIRADLTAKITNWPAPNALCIARVAAVSATGTTQSIASNMFVYQCDFSLSSANQSFPAAGGTGKVAVTTQTWCGWRATSAVSWITITSGTNGVGSGTITYETAPNTTTTSRRGALTIAGLTYTVTQAAAPNVPPTVRIVRPSNGETLSARSVRIDAESSDSDGTVTSVAFYANGVRIGASTEAQPSVRWSPDAPGPYTLTASATDNAGATTWSAPVSVTIR